MEDQPNVDASTGDNVRAGLMALTDVWGPVAEATAGYRAQLEGAGFSNEAAETMAVDFHRELIARMMAILR